MIKEGGVFDKVECDDHEKSHFYAKCVIFHLSSLRGDKANATIVNPLYFYKFQRIELCLDEWDAATGVWEKQVCFFKEKQTSSNFWL